MMMIMFSPKFNLFCVAVILCIFLCRGDSKMKSCVETEKQALLKLKDNGFIDDGHILSSWNSEIDCCQWNGISCNNLTGHVTKLSIPGKYSVQLRGNINPSLCELQYLTHLDLSFNDFKGSKIPKCIGSLTQLRKLILSSSAFVGTIPHELQNLTNLQTLDLRHNDDLIVNDLKWVSHLSSLRYLYFSYIDLSKAIDWQSSLSNYLPSLLELHLDGCSLPHQVISKSFFHMNSSTSLKVLSLVSNDLDSSVLSWVSNISKVLEHLYLGGNPLQHIFPKVFADLVFLESLDLSGTSLQHIAQDAFKNTTSLKYLSLMDNELDSSVVNSISDLCQLKDLDLYSNKLSSPLSDWIPQLVCAQSSMETLYLSGNSFDSGPFPDFSRFTSLVELNVANSSLFGSIPQSFGHFPDLHSLDLSYNNLSGRLPRFDGFLSLQELDLSNNKFEDEIPHSFGQLSSLQSLRLSSNQLKGEIDEEHLSRLSSLRILDISNNLISFNFSSNWVPSFKLNYLLASSCNIGPDFPTWLKYQTKLEILDLSNVGISNSFPTWFWNLSSNLGYLNVSHNKICGSLPKSLPEFNVSSFPSHYIWDLSFNNLSGPLTQFSPNASVLLLSNNKFSGSISSLCATSQFDLSILDLSNNMLSGSLPDCWWQFPYLQVLNLANNDFLSTIPNSFVTLTSLVTIHLNSNNLSGGIPSVKNAHYLQLLDFGQNSFNGTIPTWIGDYLPNLVVLRLEANRFRGRIPTSLCNLVSLQILDLSHNNLVGLIPHCLDNLSAMSNITLAMNIMSYVAGGFSSDMITILPSFMDTAVLTWKGEYVEYSNNLWLMTSIDLSCNHLSGVIPGSVTTLVALASLNLSMNNLVGFIPNNMGDMKRLESLDLARNTLFGEIPESFSSLNFLSYLDLSFNNLSGKIPESTQLQSFNASCYKGNEGLCGLPLSKECPIGESNSDQTLNIDANDDEDDKFISFGFYISLILGFIIGFWGVCGTLILQSSWRHAYFQFFTNIYDWICVQLVVSVPRIKRRLLA